MKLILVLSFISLIAIAEEDCPPTDSNDGISAITALSVPNCLQEESITQEVNNSLMRELRAKKNLPIPSLPSPVCNECASDFRSKMPGATSSKLDKQQAFFETSYKELEKSLSSIVVDVVGLRKSWSTGSNFSNSINSCNTSKIESELQKCGSPFLETYKGKKLSDRLANEIASLMSTNRNGVSQILDRPESLNSCPISDDRIITLKPRLFEEMITPGIVSQLANIKANSPSELQSEIRKALSGTYTTFEQHPILRELIKEPSKFLSTFQSLKSETNPQKLKDRFKDKLYSREIGNIVDNQNANKCKNTIDAFTNSLCSPKFKAGDVSLGSFSNFAKFNNQEPLDPAESTTDDNLTSKNLVAFDFCQAPASQKQSLSETLSKMNDWMLESDRNSPLSKFATEKYNRDFGDVKTGVCSYLPATDCPASDGEQCALFKLYQDSLKPDSVMFRLANTPDPNVNKVLRSIIGNSTSVSSPRAKEILIAEGILPQANGQYIERPEIKERQPEYLAGVADGSITPSSSSTTTTTPVLAQAQVNRPRPQQQAQPATFQPQVANSAAPETQVAANTSEDDQDDLRRFQDGLEERRKRAEGSQANATRSAQQSQTNRRTASRQESSDRSENSLPTADFVPSQQPQAQTQVLNNAIANSQSGTASLGKDTSRRGLADRQRNAALAEMDKKNTQPQADGVAGRGPASVDGSQPNAESTVALTISGDIRANLERVLNSTGADGANLRSLIQNKRTFKFELNNSIFDVQFNNNGYVVRPSGSSTARTLQEVFNDSLRTISERTPANQRTATLPDLNRDLENTGRN